MEAYIIIISAGITAIAIAYKIASSVKKNTEGVKMFPIVAKDGNYVLSFPFDIKNDLNNEGSIDPVKAVKGYLEIKKIDNNDIEAFKTISSLLDWQDIILNIIKNTNVEDINYSDLTNERLTNMVLIECVIELPTKKVVDLEFDCNFTIKTKWK